MPIEINIKLADKTDQKKAKHYNYKKENKLKMLTVKSLFYFNAFIKFPELYLWGMLLSQIDDKNTTMITLPKHFIN